MKRFLVTLLFCIPIICFGKDGITFGIEVLSKPEKTLPEASATEIYESLIRLDNGTDYQLASDTVDYRYNIVAQSEITRPLVSYGYHSFFEGMHRAYAEHRPFVLSPDAVWLLISQGFAKHVNANAEQLRGHFVNFSGKVSLVVITEKDLLGSPNKSWDEIFPQFTEQIAKYSGEELIDTLTADFSTTGIAEKIAAEITIMEAMKSYFEFIVMRAGCGIPEITLTGTPEDWQRVLDKTKRLAKYDLEWWVAELEPILTEFVETSKGKMDTEFWKGMFKVHSKNQAYVPDVVDGWILKFYPYDRDGKKTNFKRVIGKHNFPEEIVKVDVKYIDTVTKITTPLEFWAGFVGLEQNQENYTLTPKIGWIIRKKDTANAAMRQKLTREIREEEDFGITIRVDKVPPVLCEVEEIDTLRIFFLDRIDIPDELANVKIKTLYLDGKIDEAGKTRIKKLFPNTDLTFTGNSQPAEPEPPEMPDSAM